MKFEEQFLRPKTILHQTSVENSFSHSKAPRQGTVALQNSTWSDEIENASTVVVDPFELTLPAAQSIHKRLLKKYDSQEIYEKVWKMPIWQVARELGVRAHILSTACVRLYIPTPPRRYWTSRENSRRTISRPSMPERPDSPISNSNHQKVSEPGLNVAAVWSSDKCSIANTGLKLQITRPIPQHLLNKYDREQIYAAMWEMPLWKAATVLEVKAESLSNACIRLYIPTPPRGHWSRHEDARQLVSRPLLPSAA